MKCRDILKLPSLKDLKIVAGKRGLDNNIRWVHVGEILKDSCEIINWLYGGELLFLTGVGLRNNTHSLKDLIKKLNEKKLSGLVINVGPYIEKIPDDVLSLADDLGFPLFELPWKVKLVEVTQDICTAIIMKDLEEKSLSNLLEEILFGNINGNENLIERAVFYGYDLSRFHMVVIVDLDDFSCYLKRHGIENEKEIMKLKTQFHQIVSDTFSKNRINALTMLKSDSVLLLVQCDNLSEIRDIFDAIRDNVSNNLNGLTVSIGAGNIYDNINGYRESLKEAMYALKLAKSLGSKNNAYMYKDIGIYKFILNQDREMLEEFFNERMWKILEYDKINKTDLLYTLYVFLEEDKNMQITADKLFIHRNTLRYRLNKIAEILKIDFDRMEDCFKCIFALKVGQVIGLVNFPSVVK